MAATDSTGVIAWSNDYQPFGEGIEQGSPASATALAEAHGFTGKAHDSETGLYYYNARWYDPELGRFMTEDTFVSDLDDPRKLNLYVYVGNDPLRYTDPSGNVWKDSTIVVVQYADGGVMSFAAITAESRQRNAVVNAFLNARQQGMKAARFSAELYYDSPAEKVLKKAFSFFGVGLGGPRARNVQLVQSLGYKGLRLPDKGDDLGAQFAAFVLDKKGIGTYASAEAFSNAVFGPGQAGTVASRIIGVAGLADSIHSLDETLKRNEKMLAPESVGFDYLSQIFVMKPSMAEQYFGDFGLVTGKQIKTLGLDEAAVGMRETVIMRTFADDLELKEIGVLGKRTLNTTAEVGLNILEITLNVAGILK